MKNFGSIKKWLILCIYISFIFSNSLTPARLSSNNSDFVASLTGHFLSIFNISIAFHILTFIIRKTAHFMEYFFLGLLFQTTSSSLNHKTKHILTACMTVLIPICDELLQSITPGRSCEIRDMLIDASGILCGLLIYHLVSYLKK